MSKLVIGRHQDGSLKRVYFRRRKHKKTAIRRIMYRATQWQLESKK